jgi:hypothetical protein
VKPEDFIDPAILSIDDIEKLSYVLRLFVLEVRKTNGEKYPAGTIRSLLSGINRELIKNNINVSILDRNDYRLRELHLTLENFTEWGLVSRRIVQKLSLWKKKTYVGRKVP